uniref:Bromo domain-containing protein n=1 Tax=Astyanax mexicanus TaxID=7994 RepID=A0A8B9HRX7_ASTMX
MTCVQHLMHLFETYFCFILQMTKKKKGPDTSDMDVDEQSRTPARSDISQDKPLTPLMAKTEDKEQTPLQEALSQLIRQLQRKDPSAFFSFPVTDLIAPGYSLIIKRPMDFSSMKEKVKRGLYHSLEELKVDFKTMCENAMIYNKPETIYYKAAKKLLHSGMKILSLERIKSLKQSIEFMAGLKSPNSRMGEDGEEGSSSDPAKDGSSAMDTSDNSQSPRVASRDTPSKESKEDVQKGVNQAENDLEEIKKIIEESEGKLSNRSLQCELDFERRKSDGTTTLGILNPADLNVGDPGYCPVKLGMMGGRLQTGVNTLQGFKEDKRNRVTPVTYMNYGPFSSYAPTYDSSFANISKEESDLIYSFYGEESSLQVIMFNASRCTYSEIKADIQSDKKRIIALQLNTFQRRTFLQPFIVKPGTFLHEIYVRSKKCLKLCLQLSLLSGACLSKA